jgi:hypothetical protein
MKTIKQKLILFGALLVISPLVIGPLQLSRLIYPLIWIYLPFLMYSILGRFKPTLKIVLVILTGIIYGLTSLILFMRFILCGYGQTQDEYVNKTHENLKIIGRDFSCYGTTGDLVLYKQFSISKNIKLEFYYKTFVDYKNVTVDTAVWKRISRY